MREAALSLPFDCHGRYGLTARLLERLGAREATVLDVGGRFSPLKLFLPQARVMVVDVEAPTGYSYRPSVPFLADGYVMGAGGHLPFPDGSFEVIAAHDTLEHVPPDHRPGFLRDLLRVAGRFVILNGPVASPETDRAERRLAEFWGRLGVEMPTIREHLELGLPRGDDIVALLEAEGIAALARIPNGNALLWLTAMGMKFHADALPDGAALHEEIDRALNSVLADRDFAGPCYREAFVVAKDPSDADRARRAASEVVLGAEPLPSSALDAIDPLMARLEEHAERVRSREADAREQLSLMQASLVQREAEARIAKRTVEDREKRLVEAEDLTRRLKDETEWLRGLLEEAKAAAGEANEQLDHIRSSAGYQLADRLTGRLTRMFPEGTRRGGLLHRIRRLAYRLLQRRARGAPRPDEAEVAGAGERDTPRAGIPRTTPEDYQHWIDRTDPTPREAEHQGRLAGEYSYRPLLSVVMPTWNPDPGLLRETIESVRAQSYRHWELVVADGGSGPEARAVLGELQADPRVTVLPLDENLGISGNTNAAIERAGGVFVLFLDQSDVLAPHALYEMATRLYRDPTIDVIHSDFDLLSPDGAARFNPFFTPEWSPDLLLASNYMAHLLGIRTSLVREVGGLRPETDGAQDWDLLLRATERTDRIVRIPKVLYHWRADPTSAAMTLETKPEAERNQRRAVQDALDRRGWPAEVERTEQEQLRIRWRLERAPLVSIVIPTRHNREMLRRVLEGIERSGYPDREVLVVETAGRTEEREAWYRELAGEHDLGVLWWDEPFNYSAVNNMAARQARGEVLLFLNDDTEPLTGDWLEELVGWALRDEIGVVGAQLVGPDGRIQHHGVVIGLGGFADHLHRGLLPGEWSLLGSTMWYRNHTAVTGACLAVRREVFEEVGGWDERFVLCGSDVELCLRIRDAGRRVLVTPFARVMHVEAATRGGDVPEGDYCESFHHYQRFLFGGDPYFSPNLSYDDPVPRLRRGEDRTLSIVGGAIGRDLVPRGSGDPHEAAVGMAKVCRLEPGDLERIASTHASLSGRNDVGSVNWFIPDFDNPFYGGIHTILRFADHFQRAHGVKNRFVVLGAVREPYIRSGVRLAFPDLADAEIFVAPEDADELIASLPSADASIATLWTTAYPLARYRNGGRKFYFVQDYEPMFYPAGALYALAEETYRMGFYGIANTPPLKEIYESYGGVATSFHPCVDTDLFHANRPPRDPDDPFTVFLYGRPGHPRNCYELAIAALGELKERLGERVRIVAAGAWGDTGMGDDWIQKLGLLKYEETADLYRRCDAGLVLSVSKHPTYIPLQLMATGALVVANLNPANTWLLRDGKNCLLAEPTADALAGALEAGLTDGELRARLTSRALEDIRERHSDWEREIEHVYGFLCDPVTPDG